tara:strand:- start:131 stop:361 length:231 start_codon:yes stop_codon:yes gene_type:complete
MSWSEKMSEIINTACGVCGMELHQIGICPACGHNQNTLDYQEEDTGQIEIDLPYGIDFAPPIIKQIHIPYGINDAP